MSEIKRVGNDQKGKFVIQEDGEEAGFITYENKGDNKIATDETRVYEKFEGKGLAKKLVMKAVEYARENNLKIIPVCPYVEHRFKKDEEIRDVLAKD